MKYNKFTNIRQHNNCLLEHIGYMFRPVNRSSSDLQQNKPILDNTENPKRQYHTSITASSESTVALIIH